MFGSALQNELDKQTGKDANRKRHQILAKWLDLPDHMRFRSPMATRTAPVPRDT